MAVRSGDLEAARRHLRDAIATANSQRIHLYALRAATSLARVHLDFGEKRAARDLLETTLGNFTDEQEFPHLSEARRLAAEAATS